MNEAVAISVAEASVKTAAVEVRVLTVSGKQVTLAVFRQLQEEPLISDTGEFRGKPWGRVNYFWGCCRPDHLHVVWQLGDELRRDCVYESPIPVPLQHRANRLLRVMRLVEAASNKTPARDLQCAIQWGRFRCERIDTRIYEREGTWPREIDFDFVSPEIGQLAFDEPHFVQFPEDDYATAIRRALDALHSEDAAFVRNWKQRIAEIRKLDQLFIAI